MLKKILQLFSHLFLLSFMLFLLIWHHLVIYGLSQGKGQLIMVWNSQPLEEVLKDPAFPDSLKQKLMLVTEIKKFAVDSLGINPSYNYTKFYNQQNRPLLLTVSACKPFSFQPKEWSFPFLGIVSYKGFFNRNKAREEIIALKGKGYDVSVYSPSGWSTLGWFKDPVLSNMLYQSEGSLSNTIIHELTHGTLYVKNDVTFNENLASFVGDKGAESFLIYKFGKDSKQYIEYDQSKTDEKMYNEYILKSVERLDSLYSSFSGKENGSFKLQKKNKLIFDIVVGVNRLPLHNKKRFFHYSLKAFIQKNAFFMTFTRYDSQYELFEKEYREKSNSNLRNYLALLKAKYPSL